MKHRTDRYKKSSDLFQRLGIPVHYYHPKKHPKSGKQGCFESHINVMRDAWNKGYRNLLIFEDDVAISWDYDEQRLQEAIDFMQNDQTWDIFFLGSVPYIARHRQEQITDSIYRVNALFAHAYVVSRRMMEKMKDVKYIGVSIDFLYLHMEDCYAIYPSLFYQYGSESDVDTKIQFYNHGKLSGSKIYLVQLAEILNIGMGLTIPSFVFALSFGVVLLIILYIVQPDYKYFFLFAVILIIILLLIFSPV